MEQASFQVRVRGRVQGVFFRDFVRRHARDLGLTGYVKNLPEGKEVEVQAEGGREKLDQLLSLLRQGPPGARVEGVEVGWGLYGGQFKEFEVVR